MKRIYSILIVFIFLIVLTFWLSEKKETKILRDHISIINQKYKSDSILLKNYQDAMYDFINQNPESAKEFMLIIEKKEIN